MKECQCLPWDMIRNDTIYDYELCDYGGNKCFWEKMQYAKYNEEMDRKCFCLADCENVKYSHFATLKPNEMKDCSYTIPYELGSFKALVISKMLTPMKNISSWSKLEESLLKDYCKSLGEKITTNDLAVLDIRLEGPTYMTLKRSLKVTFADKLGSIGGTLGLFSGFSLLAIMELIHWIFRIFLSFIPMRNQSLS